MSPRVTRDRLRLPLRWKGSVTRDIRYGRKTTVHRTLHPTGDKLTVEISIKYTLAKQENRRWSRKLRYKEGRHLSGCQQAATLLDVPLALILHCTYTMPEPIILYDIPRQLRNGETERDMSWSPNVFKTRLVLECHESPESVRALTLREYLVRL